jgi:hypothetical protein
MIATNRHPVGLSLGCARRPVCRQARASRPGDLLNLRARRRSAVCCVPRCVSHDRNLACEARQWIRNRIVNPAR